MDIILSNSSDKPIYEQITSQIKGLILTGELEPGEKLPSIRALANGLRISAITTKRAYADLESQGFIATVQGKDFELPADKQEALKKMDKIPTDIIAGVRPVHVHLSDDGIDAMGNPSAGTIVYAGPLEDGLTDERLSDLFGMPIEVQHTHGRWSAYAV